MKLGSLFDGSGGFPLAGSLCGIEPKWAAEVEPYPIAVTHSRFPKMRHLGDISKVNGREVEPVDIITFGSPCQDLSVAGKRAGLKHEANGDEETTRSGLFMEAVRIIKEMRDETNGRHPTFALWENVPGAFSSNKGEDFRTVLEELIKIVEPEAVMPTVPQSGWAYADSYCGDGWSIAYRTFDAQYWGVPQRRRRIHLVIDFRGERARKILFECEGMRGYFAQGRTPWQATAGDASGGSGADDREGAGFDGYNGDLTGDVSATLGVNCGISTGRNGVIECRGGLDAVGLTNRGFCSGDKTETLRAESHGALPMVCEPIPYTGCEGGGKGALVQEDKSATLATNNDQYLFQPVPNLLLDDQSGQQVNARTDDKSPTLRAEAHGNGLGVGGAGDPMNTLTSGDRHAVAYGIGNGQANQPFSEELVGALNCMHDQQAVAFAVDCRNLTEKPELYQTLQAKPNGGQSLNFSGAVRVRCIVRRLTPTECARLQGFADRWGDIDEKDSFTPEEYKFWHEVRNTRAAINGKKAQEYTEAQMLTWYNKLHTDSAEYKMWGNGIALPPALYCMQGMADALGKESNA